MDWALVTVIATVVVFALLLWWRDEDTAPGDDPSDTGDSGYRPH